MKYQEKLKEVQVLKQMVMESLEGAPEGKLRCEMAQRKYPQYYLILKEEKEKYPRGRFLRKEEHELAVLIAQKEYDIQMLTLLKEKERLLKLLIKDQKGPELQDIYQRLSEARKRIVNPYVLPDNQYIKEWEQNGVVSKNPFPIENGYTTEKGEIVRSKTEKMIADKLYYMGIPYKYENVLKLDKTRIIYPDFTILNIRTREVFFLEHFGMMDNPEYCKKAIEKIEAYENHHIFLGDKLLITFESSQKGINMKQIEALIEKYLV